MTAAGDGRFARATFAVAALALGTPTLVFGGWLATVGLFYGLTGMLSGHEGSLLLMLWGLAGLVGLVAALTLSVSYVHGGRASLRRRAWPWWPALLTGMAAAGPWLSTIGGTGGDVLVPLLAGPLLLPVALVLALLRLSVPRTAPFQPHRSAVAP